VTNTVLTGDLTGNGITTQTATNTAVYNTNCLQVQMTDPVGNSVVTIYDPVFNFLPSQRIRFSGGTPVSTNFTIYGDATNVVINGSITQTNLAFGLPIRQIRAYESSDAATNDFFYNGNGFLTESIRHTGTGDPNVINTFYYNERGDEVSAVDALGAVKFSAYDPMDRPIETENYDEFGNPLALKTIYYDDNGEVSWTDGPRYNPDNYVFYDYDGAGRVTTEIHWRSQANTNGTGVTTPAGYNLYAQTFYQYDPVGNLLLKVDPRGAMTTNTYDSLNRLVQTRHLDTNGLTILSTDGFSYEPGGLVQSHTNARGGVTTTLYNITGKPETQYNADGSTNAWRYYLDGRIYQEIQRNGAYWQTTYDDVNRIATRTFCSAAGMPEATNSVQLDRRGNVIVRVDEGGNAFTNAYDGLDRVKVNAGPAIVTVEAETGMNPEGPITYVTNVLQEISTNFYDAAGRAETNVNALGESKINLIFSAAGTLVREHYTAYSADHNSVTVTDGSGANSIVHTTWTDTDGHAVLSIAYPSTGTTEFTLNQYDLAGNLVASQHDSSSGGAITNWTTASYTLDGLNRVTSKVDRDGALTTYAYDPLGDLTNRTLPLGSVQMLSTYNNAGQKLQDWLIGGTAGTRTNTYAYFASGSPFAGLLQTQVDGRPTTSTYSYDDFLRVTNQVASGLLPEQNLTVSWQFEPRGYVTNYSEQFASTNTGPTTSVQRSYDPYGLLATESVTEGAFAYSASQTFDAAGRRSMLNIDGANYGFAWRADNMMTVAADPTGSGSYSYDTAGMLTNRLVTGGRNTAIISRDGEGRPLTITNAVNLWPELGETLSWSGDGLLSAHTLYRPDFTDNRSYSYANMSRRVTQEQLALGAGSTWTNSFVYDQGVAKGPGALTTAGPVGASFGLWWSGLPDAFSRVNIETNNAIGYLAYGAVNGQATLSAWLDNRPIQIMDVGTNAMQWRTFLELTQGAHQLKVSALHPSGFYTAWATNSFTNNIPYQVAADSYDGNGNITNRVWRNASGTTNRTQSLSWDAKGRLREVMSRNANNYGFNWTAVYDGLNRRLATTTVLVSNGVPSTVPPQVVNSYFDPQVEFLELGVLLSAAPDVEFLEPGTSPSIQTMWKLYGPDLNGTYGGMNGTGGLEGISPYLNTFNPVISDARGNVLAEVTNGVASWALARPSGYGAVPGYRPVAFEG
jgi:YD repeat-containing protein